MAQKQETKWQAEIKTRDYRMEKNLWTVPGWNPAVECLECGGELLGSSGRIRVSVSFDFKLPGEVSSSDSAPSWCSESSLC